MKAQGVIIKAVLPPCKIEDISKMDPFLGTKKTEPTGTLYRFSFRCLPMPEEMSYGFRSKPRYFLGDDTGVYLTAFGCSPWYRGIDRQLGYIG